MEYRIITSEFKVEGTALWVLERASDKMLNAVKEQLTDNETIKQVLRWVPGEAAQFLLERSKP